MNDPSSERRSSTRVVRPTLRLSRMGEGFQKLGTCKVVNASSSGLLIDTDGLFEPLPVIGELVEGLIWDTEQPGNVPFRAQVVRQEPTDGAADQLGLHISWIEQGKYETYQELVYGG